MGRLRAMPTRLSGLPSKVRAMPKRAEPFYTSPEWRALVALRKQDPDYREALRRAREDGSKRCILDHVVERKDGGDDLDPSNTQWLTMREHQAKTARERARRAGGAGQKFGGQPAP